MPTYSEIFERRFRDWASETSRMWDLPVPDETFFGNVRKRLTDNTLKWIGYGITAGLIEGHGPMFNLPRGAPNKGPYK